MARVVGRRSLALPGRPDPSLLVLFGLRLRLCVRHQLSYRRRRNHRCHFQREAEAADLRNAFEAQRDLFPAPGAQGFEQCRARERVRHDVILVDVILVDGSVVSVAGTGHNDGRCYQARGSRGRWIVR
jgi:hypothetical protein